MGTRIEGLLTAVRAATADDADMLVVWHADPDVARYWDGETFTRAEVLARLARSNVDAYIVEEGGRPVGYIQAWTETETAGGIDMFLIPAARGRGLGPDAARALARHLTAERGWTRVTVDPELWNERAVRAWRRAGFRDVEERDADDEHASRWLLMEFGG